MLVFQKVKIGVLFGIILSACTNSSGTLSSSHSGSLSSSNSETLSSSTSTSQPLTLDYPILNHSFERVIGTRLDYEWDIYNYDAEINYSSTNSTDGEKSLELSSDFGGFVSLWQVLPIEGKNHGTKFNQQLSDQKVYAQANGGRTPRINDRVFLSADIYIETTNSTIDLSSGKLKIESENASRTKTVIGEIGLSNLAHNQWVTLSVSPTNNDGFIPEDSVLILVAFSLNIPEEVIVRIDQFNAYTSSVQNNEESSSNGSSQTPPNPVQEENVIEILNNSFEDDDLTFLVSGQPAVITEKGYYGQHSLLLSDQQTASYLVEDISAEDISPHLSLGVWVYIDSNDGEASINLRFKVNDEFEDVSTVSTQIVDRWMYLKTPLISTQYINNDLTELEIVFSTSGTSYFDFIQLGHRNRINGNPLSMAIIAYQPWFRAQNNLWANWYYNSANYGGRLYNPATIIGVGENQKRDIAAVHYPIIGTYDSTDYEVLYYHASLIKAMGIDVIQMNYYAGLPSAQYQLDVLDQLFDIGVELNIKISILYEPKIHLNGWIYHPSRLSSIQAIANDFITFLEKYEGHEALLQYNGIPMIEIFGLNLVNGLEWKTILDAVFLSVDYRPKLMGDGVSDGDYSSIESMFQWNLFRASLENGTSDAVISHLLDINQKVLDWDLDNQGSKLPVAIVYPGFDDTPIRSWQTIANAKVRKIERTGINFYSDSWQAFKELRPNFDWLIIATFNDWNEGTNIEPSRELGHQLAYLTMTGIAEFKGKAPPTLATLEAITTHYLMTRTTQYI
jgi:hypothetical protein